MKKSLIALAVAGALTAPMIAQADATLYGKFEQRLVDRSAEATPAGGATVNSDSDLKLEADDIRIGIKGTTELMGGLVGFYQLELETNPDKDAFADNEDADFVVRLGNMGVKGDFGTATFGRQVAPTERIIAYTGNLSEDLDVQDLNPDRLGNAISYVTPSFSGVTGYVALIVEGSGDDEQADVDGQVYGLNYSQGNLNLSVGTWMVDKKYSNASTVGPNFDDEKVDWVGVGGEYTFGMVKVGAMYETLDVEDATTPTIGSETKVASIRAIYMMDGATIGANYHDSEEKENDGTYTEDVKQFSIFATYSLGSKASVDIEYVDTDRKDTDGDKSERQTLSVGYNLSF